MTNSFKDLVPEYYTRKQTLTNAERYITPKLKELEDMILGAEDKLFALEYDLFCQVREELLHRFRESRRQRKPSRSWMSMHRYPWSPSAITMYAQRSIQKV